MCSNAITIRVAEPGDAAEILSVYAPYIRKTAITFEYEVPSVDSFRARMTDTMKRYPWLVACRDGHVVGYAYTGAFIRRSACDWAAETSIYIRMDCCGGGIGRLLYEAIEKVSRAQRITNLNACIAWPEIEDEYLTANSQFLHEHLGYRLVGEFHRCGYKFGRWYDLIWMEKWIDAHEAAILPMIPFPDLPKKETILI